MTNTKPEKRKPAYEKWKHLANTHTVPHINWQHKAKQPHYRPEALK